jgi:hypothetical protein
MPCVIERELSAGHQSTGESMSQKTKIWQLANSQANQIKNIKNKKAKSRQIVMLCETLKLALKAGV